MTETVEIARGNARAFAVELLTVASVFEMDAETVAEAVVAAEARGMAGDGLATLPAVVEQVATGVIDPRGRPLVMCDSPALRTLDGSSAVGAVAAAAACEWLAEAAREFGTATALVKGGRDLGDPVGPALALAEGGLLALCVTARYGEAGGTLRAACVSAQADDDGSREAVRWEGPATPLAEMVVSGLTGGRAASQKCDAPNPAIAEHVIVAWEPEAVGGAGRMPAKLRQFPQAQRLTLRDEGGPLRVAAATVAALKVLAGERGVDASPLG